MVEMAVEEDRIDQADTGPGFRHLPRHTCVYQKGDVANSNQACGLECALHFCAGPPPVPQPDVTASRSLRAVGRMQRKAA
jgi:hypothetical protein